MTTNAPRAVFVVRETEYDLLRARHATREQSRFFLQSRGQTLDSVIAQHERFEQILHRCRSAIPPDWRQTLVQRADLDRFLFGPEDLVVAVGQDGLVANVAKYLDGHPVFGVNPDPKLYDGVLVRLSPDNFGSALEHWQTEDLSFESRTMVKAELETGEFLLALNEIFVGHASHQSARYRISCNSGDETQSSSGLIVSSGTGATGWARSIMESTATVFEFSPTEPTLGYFVREPFPSISTGTAIRAGVLARGEQLVVTSMMNEGGTIFADGIEKDRLSFEWGRIASISIADKTLNLASGAQFSRPLGRT